MNVQFEWQVGDDDRWETIAQTQKRPRHKWIRKACGILIAVIVSLAAGGYIIARLRYDHACRQARFQIQNAIDLEAQALAQGDVDLFLAQQDEASPDWYAQQAARADADCPSVTGCEDERYPWLCKDQGRSWPLRGGDSPDSCSPVLPAKIQSVELRGNWAWVEVVEGQVPVRRMRFYRQTGQGWKQTAPRAEFWKKPVATRYGNVVVRYHQRDRPYIDPFLQRISEAARDACAAVLYCPSTSKVEVDLTLVTGSPHLEANPSHPGQSKITLPSPWLSGIPIDGTWDKSYLNELTYWVTYGIASTATGSASDQELSQLPKAILAEYAAWYSTQDIAQAPILRRIIERKGTDALPSVLFSLRSSRILSLFMIRWLSLHPVRDEIAFFETLLNIEREAILVGRKDTFLLLQDQAWLEHQAEFFDQAQLHRPHLSLPPVHVQAVEVAGERARVTLKEPLLPLQGHSSQSLGQFAFFSQRDRDWSWRHASTTEAAFWNTPPS